MADIGLLNRLPINEKPPVAKLHLFTLQCNDTLEEHYLVAGKAERDDVMSFWIGEEIAKLPTEIDTSVGICWLHAVSSDENGGADMAEKEIGD